MLFFRIAVKGDNTVFLYHYDETKNWTLKQKLNPPDGELPEDSIYGFGFSLSTTFCRVFACTVLVVGCPLLPYNFIKDDYASCFHFFFLF
jgi:hypothetical protein